MKDYLHYIFDFDMTLFDTQKPLEECYQVAFQSVNIDYDKTLFEVYCGENLDATFYRYSTNEELFKVFEASFIKHSKIISKEKTKPYFDTIEVIKELKK